MAKELKDMTVAEAKASGQEQEYSNLVAGYGQGTPSNLVAPTNTINSEQLAPTTGLELPKTKPTPTVATGLNASIETQTQDYKDQATKDAETEAKTSRDELTTLIKSSIGETGLTDTAYREEGVDTAKKELNDINNQIISEQVANRRRIEQIEKNAPGGLVSGVQSEVNRVNRESVAKQADLAVIQMAKQNNYFGAKEIADRSVQAKMEEQRQNIDLLKFIYDENKADFTKADDRAYQAMISKKEREADKEEAELKMISDLALDALQNGASTETVVAMRQAKTVDDALNVGGKYVGALDRQAKLQQLANKGMSTSERISLYEKAVEGNQEAITALGYDPRNLPQVKADQLLANEESYNNLQTDIDRLNGMLDDEVTLNNVTGAMQNRISTFANWEGLSFTEQVKALSEKREITTGGISAINKRNDFLNSANYIISNFTFDKLRELKAGGATFGALSDGELRAIAGAATRLGSQNTAIRDKNERIIGFRGSKEQIIEDLKFIQQKYKKAQDSLNINAGLSESDKLEIINL